MVQTPTTPETKTLSLNLPKTIALSLTPEQFLTQTDSRVNLLPKILKARSRKGSSHLK